MTTGKRLHRRLQGAPDLFEISEIAAVTSGRILGPAGVAVSGVSTDSRKVSPGELFVPLKGERFDGHDYISQVAGAGVTSALADERWVGSHQIPEGISCVAVKNTLRALGDLAASWRSRFNIPVVAVTGSNGKTTTKEMLASILRQTGDGLATEGNLNNLIGLPLMVFKLRSEHLWAVFEMGMSEPGEIERLAEIAAPQTGIVLNAFPAHLASMGTVEAVAAAKGELLHRISDNGVAVVNADDPRIASLHQNPSARRISFGLKRGEVRADNIRPLGADGQQFTMITPAGKVEVMLSAFGKHNIYNALAASAALVDHIPLEVIAAGLSAFRPYKGRFRMEKIAGVTLIDDTYNSNPASTSAALATLGDLKGSGKAFVALGDMLELGGNEAGLHRVAGGQAAQVADHLYLVGTLTDETAEGALDAGMAPESVMKGMTHEAVAEGIARLARPGDIILLKGSRGMKMEKIAELIRQSGFQEN